MPSDPLLDIGSYPRSLLTPNIQPQHPRFHLLFPSPYLSGKRVNIFTLLLQLLPEMCHIELEKIEMGRRIAYTSGTSTTLLSKKSNQSYAACNHSRKRAPFAQCLDSFPLRDIFYFITYFPYFPLS